MNISVPLFVFSFDRVSGKLVSVVLRKMNL